jgi:hypothetical protein
MQRRKFTIGDKIRYDYQSSGFWRKVEALITDTDDDCYEVKITKVLDGPAKLSGGTILVGKTRTPRVDWVDARASKVEETEEEPTTEIQERGDAVNLSGEVKNLDHLFELSGLDKDAWNVERLTISAREVTEEGEITDPMFQLWARLKPNQVGELRNDEWQEEFLRKLQNISPTVPDYSQPDVNLLSEVNLSDAHLRMLSWEDETGYNYDLNIACEILKEAGRSLIYDSVCLGAGKINLVIGNDMFHSDSNEPFTSRSKNILDTDSRYTKGFEKGVMSLREVIDFAWEQFEVPINVIPIPGNHDAETVYFLGQVLNAYYCNNPNVTVDTSPKVRKYYRHGKCIVLLEHGDRSKKKSMPDILARENPDISWLSHPHRECHFGHIHTEVAQDMDGVILRWVPGLAPPDHYHFQEGYVGSIKGSQAFVFDSETGLRYILYHRTNHPVGE